MQNVNNGVAIDGEEKFLYYKMKNKKHKFYCKMTKFQSLKKVRTKNLNNSMRTTSTYVQSCVKFQRSQLKTVVVVNYTK